MRRAPNIRRPWLALTAVAIGLVAVVAIAWAHGRLAPRLALSINATGSDGTEYAFVPESIGAPPHTRVVVTLVNSSDAPHTLVMLEPIDRRTDVIVAPGARDALQITTPGPGRYRFVCTVHENMAGTLVVHEGD